MSSSGQVNVSDAGQVNVSAAGQLAAAGPRPRSGHPFRLGVEQDGGTLYLHLAGEFEWECVGRVEAALERVSKAHTRRVVFDLEALSFLDVAGLRMLLRAHERARTEPFDVIVVRPRGLVNRVFTLTRAGRELTMVDGVPGAG